MDTGVRSGGEAARCGFTITEMLIAISLLGIALTLVAQVGLWALRDRGRASEHQAMLEFAANVLEAARARPFADLTPAWAAGQRLPEEYAERGWRLAVRVEPEKDRPHLRRVTVTVQLETPGQTPPRPIALIGVFAARTAEAKGGKS